MRIMPRQRRMKQHLQSRRMKRHATWKGLARPSRFSSPWCTRQECLALSPTPSTRSSPSALRLQRCSVCGVRTQGTHRRAHGSTSYAHTTARSQQCRGSWVKVRHVCHVPHPSPPDACCVTTWPLMRRSAVQPTLCMALP